MNQVVIAFVLYLSVVLALPSPKFHEKSTAPRIINGQAAKLGQFPWQAALFIDGESGSWFCGGSIIKETWILTAGHCVNGAVSGKIYTGTLIPNSGTVSTAIKFILHENYDGNALANDIGLIKLAEPLKLDENTAIIKYGVEPIGTEVNVTASGWGITHDGDKVISSQLNFVGLVTISNNDCDEYYGSVRAEIVCAVSPDSKTKSTCSGDSGGALIHSDDNLTIQVGVVSFVSSAGCESGAPSGYTRVARYRDWIDSHTL